MNANTIHGALHSTRYWGCSHPNARAKDPIIGALATNAIDFVSNTSACTRQLNACVLPGPQPVAFSALGATTPFGAIPAAIALKNAYVSCAAASDAHDGVGLTISGADAISRIAQVPGAIAYFAVRFLSIANEGFHRLSNLSYLAPYFSIFGDSCFAILFFFVGVLGLRSCLETSEFITKLDSAVNDLHSKNIEELQALIGEMTGHAPAPADTKISKRDLYVHLGQQLRSMLDEMDPELTAKLWDKDLGRMLFKDKDYKKMLPAVLARMGIEADDLSLESLKTNSDVIQKVWAKEQKVRYDRILGSKGSELVGRAKEMNLYDLISNQKTEKYGVEVAQRLLGKLKTCAKDQRHRMIAYTISGFAGALFTILAYTASPAHAIVYSVGTFLSFVGIAYGDFIGLRKAMASEGPVGSQEKRLLKFHLALGVAALILAIALTVLTSGIFPVAAVVIVGLVWICMDLYALRLANEKEKAYNAEHPTLEMFAEQIKKDGSLNTALKQMKGEHALKMFHKLPKVQREAILRSIYDNLSAIDPKFIKKLRTFPSDKSEAFEGWSLYNEMSTQNKDLTKRALKQANKILIGKKKLEMGNLETHENRDLFYKAFYQEFVQREQRNLLRRAGSSRLLKAVEKVSKDRMATLACLQKTS